MFQRLCIRRRRRRCIRDRYYAMQKGGVVASGPTAELSKEVVDRFLSV